jgi:phosphatidyl-myo-inositol dimannoside synthase
MVAGQDDRVVILLEQPDNMPFSAPRIQIVTRNFPPLLGGMERLLHHAYLELRKDYEVAIVGPSGCEPYLDRETPRLTCAALPVSRFLLQCQWQAYKMACNVEPNLILAGSGLAAPAACFAGWKIGAPVACYLHGLDIVSRNPLYRKVFLPAIRSCAVLLVNSRNTERLASQAGIDPSRIHIVHPGVSLPTASLGDKARSFRDRIGAGARPILLSVGRLTRRKGIVEFIREVMPLIVAELPEILLVVIGDEPHQAVDGVLGMRALVDQAIRSRGLAKNLALLGRVDDETLSAAYAASQLFVFPVVECPGDVEGFGMVALEAAAHGLPTLAFAVGGVVDAVADGISGYLLAPGNYRGFASRVVEHLRATTPRITKGSCLEFADRFTWDRFGERLRGVCEQALGRNPFDGSTPMSRRG